MPGRRHRNGWKCRVLFTRSSSRLAGGRINFMMHYKVSKVADGITFFSTTTEVWGQINPTGQVANPFAIKQPDDEGKGWQRAVRYPTAQRRGTSGPFPHRRRARCKDERNGRRLLRRRQKRFPADRHQRTIHCAAKRSTHRVERALSSFLPHRTRWDQNVRNPASSYKSMSLSTRFYLVRVTRSPCGRRVKHQLAITKVQLWIFTFKN